MKKMKKEIFKIRRATKLPKIARPNGSPYKIPKPKHLVAMIARVGRIQRQLDEVRPLYRELDEITLSLLSASMTSMKMRELLEKQGVSLIDNFAEKNTQFRTVGIRRYELKWK